MRILPLLILFSALSSAPVAAQTRLQFCFFADTYNPDPSQGLWYAYPDLGNYTRLNSSTGYEDIAADARNDPNYFLTSDRFQNQTIEGSGVYWNLPSLRLGCIGEGRDGFLYAQGSGGIFYRLDVSTRTYLVVATGGAAASDLAADVDGTLYGVAGNQLLRVDTSTGAKILVATLSRAVNAFGISHDGRFWGIETVRNGFSPSTNKLYQLDPVSGTASFVMNLPNCESWNYPGMASESGPPQPMNSVLLSGPGSASAGAAVSISISAAPASSLFVLLASKTLGHPFYGGQPFDLGEPISRVATGRTDGLGAAAINLVVPGVLSGKTIHLEAAIRARGTAPVRIYDSNVHSVVVL